jgi:hypothetical protein
VRTGRQRRDLLGRQQRVGDVELLTRVWSTIPAPIPRAALLAAAAAAFVGCGGSDRSAAQQPPLPPAYPVAKATTATPTPAVQPAAATQPGSGGATDTGGATTTTPTPAPGPATHTLLSAADRASFRSLEASLGGQAGVAVSALGLGQRVQQAGSLGQAIAWSTAKVPIAMAIYQAGLAGAQQQNLRAAITASDNAAAEALWSALGGGAQAAQAADAQLRAAGDDHTNIQPNRLRAGFTPFGQTVWKLTDQARFTAGMACVPAGAQVLGLMNQVVSGQRWGLGSAGVQAQLKGGWGPGVQPGVGSGYLDRQMGVLTIHGKPIAVSVAALPTNGSHDTGISNLTAIARWLVSHVDVTHASKQPRC